MPHLIGMPVVDTSWLLCFNSRPHTVCKVFFHLIQSFYGPAIEKLYFAIYTTLHHFLSISLVKQWSIPGHVLLLCTIMVCTRIVYMLYQNSLHKIEL